MYNFAGSKNKKFKWFSGSGKTYRKWCIKHYSQGFGIHGLEKPVKSINNYSFRGTCHQLSYVVSFAENNYLKYRYFKKFN